MMNLQSSGEKADILELRIQMLRNQYVQIATKEDTNEPNVRLLFVICAEKLETTMNHNAQYRWFAQTVAKKAIIVITALIKDTTTTAHIAIHAHIQRIDAQTYGEVT